MKIKFDEDPLVVEQNNYPTKTLNASTFFDWDTYPDNSLRYFTWKNCLFGTTSIVKNSDKQNWMYSGYGIAFDGAWSFVNDYAWNLLIFGGDNSS